jgi:hypothetical protein
VALLHAVNNAVSGEFVSPMFAGADAVRQGWLLVAVWAVAAGVIVLATGPALVSRRATARRTLLAGPVTPSWTPGVPRYPVVLPPILYLPQQP